MPVHYPTTCIKCFHSHGIVNFHFPLNNTHTALLSGVLIVIYAPQTQHHASVFYRGKYKYHSSLMKQSIHPAFLNRRYNLLTVQPCSINKEIIIASLTSILHVQSELDLL